jgi:hypothetical protein
MVVIQLKACLPKTPRNSVFLPKKRGKSLVFETNAKTNVASCSFDRQNAALIAQWCKRQVATGHIREIRAIRGQILESSGLGNWH